ncbi:helix-turn-helix domain-containing protein [Nocardia yamanashiensis]|uniref:helix-turn-helix domain-containing protein n=1 Tax=Nocardia yamanashiensis TaxID=209247 RepID=UPI00082CCA7A|nr:helix-turn-helix domain-containing protein [Nocardia yamanashiensis]
MDESHLAIAGYLRERRNTLRLTRAELARKAGVSEGLIQKLEQGRRPPTTTALAALFQALDVPLMYREYAAMVLQPELTTLTGGIPEPTRAELNFLESFPHPACFQTAPGFDLVATNAAYRRAFPGLRRGANILEWFLLSPHARSVFASWERETHRMVQAFRHMGPGQIAPERIEEIIAACAPAPDWQRFWATDIDPAEMDWRPLRIRPADGDGAWIDMQPHLLRCEMPRREWYMYSMVPCTGDPELFGA